MRTRQTAQAINESFQSDILRALFYINKQKHTNIKGKEENALSVDGANFALAFPIQWDKLTDKNIRFIVDNDFESYIPQNGSFNGKPVSNTAIRDKKTMGRYAIDSFMGNADKSGEMKELKGDAFKFFGELGKRYPNYQLQIGDDEVLLSKVCDIIRNFLQKLMVAKENEFISIYDHDILASWESILPQSLVKTVPNSIRNFINKSFDESVGKEKVGNKGEMKYPIVPGIHYTRALDHEYLGQYDNVSDLIRVSVKDFMSVVEEEKYAAHFDKTAKEAIKEAFSEYETSQNGENIGYLPNKAFINTYQNIRLRQFHDLPELKYVPKSEAKDGKWTGKQISEECAVLRSIYRDIQNGEKMKRSSEVYDIITRILSRREIVKDLQKGRMLDFVLDAIIKKSDEEYLYRTGDFSLALLMGANLKIKYVISSVYLDPMNYNMVGTYNKQYVYGWKEGLPLTTVEDAISRRVGSVSDEDKKKGEQLVNCNMITKSEIMSDIANIHCALFIEGTLDDAVSADEMTVNKYIVKNLGGDETKMERTRTNSGQKWKVTGDLNVVAEQLDKDGVSYERTRFKGEDVLLVSPEYYKKLKQIAKQMHITSFEINAAFDDLDELYKDFNIFLDNAITDDEFSKRYVKLFEELNKDSIGKSKKLKSAVKAIVNEDHVLDIMNKLREESDNSSQIRIATDLEVVNQLDAQNLELRFNPVFAKLRTPIDEIFDDINNAFEVNRVGLRIDSDIYTTLGQNARAYSTKVRNRYFASKDAVLTDREKAQKAPEASSFRDSNINQEDLRVIANTRNVIFTTLDKYLDTEFDVKSKSRDRAASYTGTDLVKAASDKMKANFTKVEKIKSCVNDLVSESINAINRLDDTTTKKAALNKVAAYIRDNIRILVGISKDVKPLDENKPLSEATEKIDKLVEYLTYMMEKTDAFRAQMEKFGIYLTSKGPGE